MRTLRFAPIWLLAAGVVVGHGQQPLRFDVAVRAVAIDVLVTRDGRPVSGLSAADFQVFDNGVEQRVDVARLDALPMTLLLVLDTSRSVEGETLDRLRAAARAAAAALSADDSVGLMTFSDHVRLRLAPTSQPGALGEALQDTTADGATRLYDAVFAAIEQRRRSTSRTLVLVFSDGADTASWIAPQAALTAAQRSDAVVHVVSTDPVEVPVTPPQLARRQLLREAFAADPVLFGRMFLPRLVEETGGLLLSSTTDTLGEAFVNIVTEYRSRYLVSYQPSGPDRPGWHDVDVKVRGRGLAVRARRGYQR